MARKKYEWFRTTSNDTLQVAGAANNADTKIVDMLGGYWTNNLYTGSDVTVVRVLGTVSVTPATGTGGVSVDMAMGKLPTGIVGVPAVVQQYGDLSAVATKQYPWAYWRFCRAPAGVPATTTPRPWGPLDWEFDVKSKRFVSSGLSETFVFWLSNNGVDVVSVQTTWSILFTH